MENTEKDFCLPSGYTLIMVFFTIMYLDKITFFTSNFFMVSGLPASFRDILVSFDI